MISHECEITIKKELINIFFKCFAEKNILFIRFDSK